MTDDKNIELPAPRACPFCRQETALGVTLSAPFFSYCNHCGAEGPKTDTIESAVLAWNGHVQ